MKFALQITTAIISPLVIFPAVAAQPINKDRERAENERDLELRSWNLRIPRSTGPRWSPSKPRPGHEPKTSEHTATPFGENIPLTPKIRGGDGLFFVDENTLFTGR